MRVGSQRPPAANGPYERSIRLLTKRYPNVRADVDERMAEIVRDREPIPSPPNVTLVQGIGRTIVKVRVASRDIPAGKSGGFRLLICHCAGDEWARVLVYAKTDQENAPKATILAAITAERL